MSILRDERLVALHDLVEVCRASARLYALAAEMLPDEPRARELQALAEQRNGEADFFGERMRESHDIPAGSPEERDLLQTALAGVKAALNDDGEASLLADCRAQEQDVLRQAGAAAKAPLHAAEKTAAAALADDARRRLEQLLQT